MKKNDDLGRIATRGAALFPFLYRDSALLDFELCRRADGRFLLRIEYIDPARCRPEYEDGIYRDLTWLGLEWQEPVRRQSQHMDDYRAATKRLDEMDLL